MDYCLAEYACVKIIKYGWYFMDEYFYFQLNDRCINVRHWVYMTNNSTGRVK